MMLLLLLMFVFPRIPLHLINDHPYHNLSPFFPSLPNSILYRRRPFSHQDLIRMLVDLRNSSNFLEDFHVMLRKLNNEYRETYVKRAHDHAMELMRVAIRLQR